jgi:hypothetical protein
MTQETNNPISGVSLKHSSSIISDDRMRELREYATSTQPMTDAEVRLTIIKKREASGLKPLHKRALEKEVRMINRGDCSMSTGVVPKHLATEGERLYWMRSQTTKGPQNKEEQGFVNDIKRLQERNRMNSLSLEVEEKESFIRQEQEETDRLRKRRKSEAPDVKRGQKVHDGASKGGKQKAEQLFKEKIDIALETLADYMRENCPPAGFISVTRARKVIAKRYGIHYKTLERHRTN